MNPGYLAARWRATRQRGLRSELARRGPGWRDLRRRTDLNAHALMGAHPQARRICIFGWRDRYSTRLLELLLERRQIALVGAERQPEQFFARRVAEHPPPTMRMTDGIQAEGIAFVPHLQAKGAEEALGVREVRHADHELFYRVNTSHKTQSPCGRGARLSRRSRRPRWHVRLVTLSKMDYLST